MSNAVFPTLAGLTWDIEFTDIFDTVIYTASNHYEVRVPKLYDPLFNIKLKYSVLRDNLVNDELNTLRGFFRARQGSYDSFLLDASALTRKATDGLLVNQPLTLTGTNLYTAPFVRTNGSSGYLETIYNLHTLTNIKENGSTSSSVNYAIRGPSASGLYDGVSLPGVVVQFYTTIFHVTPRTPTLPLTSDFSFYYRVRFEKDSADFNAFMFQLYEMQEIDLVTARDF